MNHKKLSPHIILSILPRWIALRHLESYGVAGLKKYGLNTLWPLLARSISMIIGFVVSIYLVRYLGPENYGQLSYATSFTIIFSILASFGIDTILYRELVRHPEKEGVYLGTATILKTIFSIAAMLITIAAAFITTGNDASRTVIIILSFNFIVGIPGIISTLFSARVAEKYNAINTIIIGVTLNALKILIIMTGAGVIYIGSLALVETALGSALLILRHHKLYGNFSSWSFDRDIAKQLLTDSWPFIFISVFSTIYSRIDQVMLKHLINSSAVGLYDSAVRIAEAWLFVPGTIVTSLFPAIVNARKTSFTEYKKRISNLIVILLIIASSVAIFVTLTAKQLIAILYGPAFVPASGVLVLYLWSGIWISLDMVSRQYLIIENKRAMIFFTTLATSLLNIILNFILIPKFGITGSAWATFISYALLTTPLVMLFLKKRH